MTTTKRDTYQLITDQVLELLAAGTVPWRKPWSAEVGLPRSLSSGKPYRGMNVFILGITAQVAGYASPWWGTYKQIASRGGQVRRGEKSTTVILWKRFEKTVEEDGDRKKKSFMTLRSYNVFNAAQVDDAEGKTFKVPALKGFVDHDPIVEAEGIVTEYLEERGPTLNLGGDIAAYSPLLDTIVLPIRGSFDTAEEYYSTFFHEMGHSTGHQSRLNRPGVTELGSGHRFGEPAYAEEELVAEMTAAMLAGVAGIEQTTLDNSAAYLANWAKKLGEEPKLVVQAAAKAQKAADLILGTTFEDEAPAPEKTAVAA